MSPVGPIKDEEAVSASKEQGSPAKRGRAYPLYPSVVQLLRQNGLDTSTARSISATGPNGRLLKGDVLAYLGIIEPTYPRNQSDRLAKLSHLDLTNINRTTARQPSPQIPQGQKEVPQSTEADSEITVPISFEAVKKVQQRVHEALGIDIPLQTFISRAVKVSNKDLPRRKRSPTVDELFDQVLGLDSIRHTRTTGTFSPQIVSLHKKMALAVPTGSTKPDIIDFLTGAPTSQPAVISSSLSASSLGASTSFFSVVVPKSEEERGKMFLERMKTILQVDPGRLVL